MLSQIYEYYYKIIKSRSYIQFDQEAFLGDIMSSILLNNIFNQYDLETAWKSFSKEFKRICDLHAPLREHIFQQC